MQEGKFEKVLSFSFHGFLWCTRGHEQTRANNDGRMVNMAHYWHMSTVQAEGNRQRALENLRDKILSTSQISMWGDAEKLTYIFNCNFM